MNLFEIKNALHKKEYSFLSTNPKLNHNIILLGLGGSHAYGTYNADSDLDIRGIALNSKQEILLGNDFEQVVDVKTDTVIYSFRKIIQLLCNCNPNTIEILGLKPEQYLYLSPIGEELLSQKHLFLSKKAVQSFGGYANSQLYRLNQKSAHQLSQKELEKHILRTLKGMEEQFPTKYTTYPKDAIKLYTDKAIQPGYDTEIFMDVNLHHYPLRDYTSLWSEMQNTVKAYGKIGKRNEKAIEHGKIGKHMMHLIRLYMMCLDILEKGEIITYREKEHDLLMSIRNGAFLDENEQPIPEFMDMVREYEKRLEYAKQNTSLPEAPNQKDIDELVASINEKVVKESLDNEFQYEECIR